MHVNIRELKVIVDRKPSWHGMLILMPNDLSI